MVSFFSLSFLRAVMIAVMCHVVILFFFVFTWKGTPEEYRIDFVFWGSILRLQDVMLEKNPPSGRSVFFMTSSPALGSVEKDVWNLGSRLEKPAVPVVSGMDAMSDPPRFVTERVEPLQGQEEEPDLGIPEAPKVFLRRSQL